MKKFFFIAALFLSVSATAQPPCKGTTKAGQPCKSIIISKETGYCNAHNPNRAKCESRNAKGGQCGMPPLKGQHFCRMHNAKK